MLNEQLRTQKNKESSKVGQWSYKFDDKSIDWSPEVYDIFEYPENYSGSLIEFYLSSIDERTVERLPEMLDIFNGKKGSSVMSQTIITPTGKKKCLSFSSSPLLDDEGMLIGVKGGVIDVTDEIEGKNGLNNFFSMSNDLHCITHLDTYFLKVSPAWSKLLGYSEEELLSRSFLNFIHPDDVDGSYSAVVEVDKDSTSLTFENRYLKKNGEVVYLSWMARIDPLTDLGYCTARNITASKKDTDKLMSSLSDKDLLLREIHHRVKNNLQIITSLLSLQAGANEEEEHLTKLYQDSKNRIQSIAAIHEMFYESEQLDKIEVGKYLNKLISILSTNLDAQNKLIDFTIEVELAFVNLDIAIPLGLIINEIATNSIKYGKDNDGDVTISVSLKTLKDDEIQIVIGDTGINSLENVLNEKSDSLGIMLINSLVEQIDGKIEQIYDDGGTTFVLTFENKID